jgi:hypothetical protein
MNFKKIMMGKLGGIEMKEIAKGIILLVMLLATLTSAMAVGEIVSTATPLNYYTATNHVISVKNNGALTTDVNTTLPSGWSWVSGSGCTFSAPDITCAAITSSTTATFTITSNAADANHLWTPMTFTATNSYTSNNVNFLRIQCGEIFHTLVEYGRGRGNYFYDSLNGSTSASTGTGYPYVPDNSDFELNYLHKIYNVKQYFNDATGAATNVSFTCTYPEQTVVREHLTTGISRNGTVWTATYGISSIEGSWERMGFLGQDYAQGVYTAGQAFNVGCTNIQYYLPNQDGWVQCPADAFTMTVVNATPITMTALSAPSSVCNGTSEVAISYVFTNTGQFPMKDSVFEVKAPQYSQFVGTRGELWGYGEDTYRYELVELLPGQSESITLIARFDTTGQSGSVLLTQSVKATYIPTWEVNSYNPLTQTQNIATSTSAAITGTVCSIANIQNQLATMNSTLNSINTNVQNIQTTVNDIQALAQQINGTTISTQTTVNEIQSTVNQINATTLNVQSTVNNIQLGVNEINATTYSIKTDTTTIIEQLDCDTVADTPICQYVLDINNTINGFDFTTINNYLNQINQTTQTINNNQDLYYNNIQNNFSAVFNEFTTIQSNFTQVNNQFNTLQTNITEILNQINIAQQYLNCSINTLDSVCYRLGLLESYSLEINSTTWNNYNNILSVNGSVNTAITNINTVNNNVLSLNTTLVNLINNQFANITSGTTQIMNELNSMQSFNEELVFLVTDSVGMQKQAATDFQKGDMQATMDGLVKAQKNLETAARIIEKQKSETQVTIDTQGMSVLEKLSYFVKKWVSNIF